MTALTSATWATLISTGSGPVLPLAIAWLGFVIVAPRLWPRGLRRPLPDPDTTSTIPITGAPRRPIPRARWITALGATIRRTVTPSLSRTTYSAQSTATEVHPRPIQTPPPAHRPSPLARRAPAHVPGHRPPTTARLSPRPDPSSDLPRPAHDPNPRTSRPSWASTTPNSPAHGPDPANRTSTTPNSPAHGPDPANRTSTTPNSPARGSDRANWASTAPDNQVHAAGPAADDPDARADSRTGWSALACVALLPVAPALAPLPLACALAAPLVSERKRRRRQEAALVDQLPDVVDLLTLTTAAGLPVTAALTAIADRPGGPLGAAMGRAAAHLGAGGTVAGALAHVTAVGPTARPLVDALTHHDRYGSPLLPALERVAIETRARRRRHAEESARRLPVTLLFPLLLTTFPAFVALTVVPLLAGSLGELSL